MGVRQTLKGLMYTNQIFSPRSVKTLLIVLSIKVGENLIFEYLSFRVFLKKIPNWKIVTRNTVP